MIALLSTIFGLASSIFPSIVKLLEKSQDYRYELELTKLKIDAATKGLEINAITEGAKADVEEGKSLRDHDHDFNGNEFFDNLRASVRPVLTYLFFILFCGIKIAAATLMFEQGRNSIEILNAVWDVYTIAIFGSIMGFWFGSRAIINLTNIYSKNSSMFSINTNINNTVKKK